MPVWRGQFGLYSATYDTFAMSDIAALFGGAADLVKGIPPLQRVRQDGPRGLMMMMMMMMMMMLLMMMVIPDKACVSAS
jgi:hypothetical protein